MVRRILWFLFLAAPGTLPAQGVAPAPAAAKYFEPAAFINPQLSPSGKWLAARTRFDDRHYALSLVDPESNTQQSLVQSEGMSVQAYWWKSDDLIMFLLAEDNGVRTFRSVDLRAKKLNNLEELRTSTIRILDSLPDDPVEMLMATEVEDTKYGPVYIGGGEPVARRNEVLRVNVVTGRSRVVEADPGGAQRWFIDDQGQVMGVWGYSANRWYLLWREAEKKWHRVEHAKNEPPEWIPVGLAADQRRLVVQAKRGGPFSSFCFYDPMTGSLEDIPGIPGMDASEYIGWGVRQIPVGVQYDAEGGGRRFFHPEAEEYHRWLGTVFPGFEIDGLSFSRDNNRVVIRVSSSVTPGVYYLADRALRKVLPIGSRSGSLNPREMAAGQWFNFQSSDGLKITGRITRPLGGKKAPLVLMIPTLNGRVGSDYSAVTQFLVRQGYAVAQINPRGTLGFGRDFAIAGDMQINGAAGRDLVEGVKWLADQGWIERERVAVFALGTGGLLALPLVAEKENFKAFVNRGMTLDISEWKPGSLLYPSRSEDDLLAAAGGRKGFDDYRKALDPLAGVAKLAIPSLHLYDRGVNDQPSPQTLKLQAALKKLAGNHQIVFEEKIQKPPMADWVQTGRYYEAIAAFLAKNL